MSGRPFDLGLYVGRFQHFHIGHQAVLDQALLMCDRVLVLVGSSQEQGTLRNPYSAATRIEMIREIYPYADLNVLIHTLPDLSGPDDITPEWGRHVLQAVKQITRKLPEMMIYGNDEARSAWFDPQDIATVSEVIISRYLNNISATQMRSYLLRADEQKYADLWHKHAHPRLHKHFDRLRGELLRANAYADISRRLAHRDPTWHDKGDWLDRALRGAPVFGEA